MTTDSPIDRETTIELRALIEGSEAHGFTGFIRQYVQDGLDCLEVLQSAAAIQDAPALQRAAHTLKGSGANFGAAGLISLCVELESAAKKKDAAAAGARVPLLVAEFERVRRALEAL